MSLVYTKKLLVAIILTVTHQELTKGLTLAKELTINSNSLWSEVSQIVGFLLNKCLLSNNKDNDQVHRNDNAAAILENCFKRKGLRALDRALSHDIIEITDNVVLIKCTNDKEVDDKNNRVSRVQKWTAPKTFWYGELAEKFKYFLKTRVLQITFKGSNGSVIESEARHRQKNNMMGQIMMFGLVSAGFIVIPLGFQFLAVLGGKALLLAKLALLLTSIQGLKKIATSHVNYGLYSTGHGGPWNYDRKWHYEGDPYPSSFYSSPLGTQTADHYVQSSVLPPIYNGLHPRGEDHLEY